MTQIHTHPDREALAQTIAHEIAEALAHAIEVKGAALLAVSGGSTPAPAYEALSNAGLDWSKVTVVLVDERWVDEDHEKSNAAFIKRTLLKNHAHKARFVALKTDGETPQAGLAELEARLAPLAFPPDAALMGMGADGHTASWFPRAHGLDAALTGRTRAAAISGAAGAAASGQDQRVTLTCVALEGAGWMGLMITGADKKAALDEALRDGPVEAMPVRAILNDPALRIHWAV